MDYRTRKMGQKRKKVGKQPVAQSPKFYDDSTFPLTHQKKLRLAVVSKHVFIQFQYRSIGYS
jgi:hypothetical protein